MGGRRPSRGKSRGPASGHPGRAGSRRTSRASRGGRRRASSYADGSEDGSGGDDIEDLVAGSERDDDGLGGRAAADADGLINLGLSPDDYNAVSNLVHAASSSNGSPALARRVSPTSGMRGPLDLRSLADSAVRAQRQFTPGMRHLRGVDHGPASVLAGGVAASAGMAATGSPGAGSMISPMRSQPFLTSPTHMLAPGSRASSAHLGNARGRTAAGQVSSNPLSSPQGWYLGSALRHDSGMAPVAPGTRMSANPFTTTASVQRPPRAGRAALLEHSPLPSSRKSLCFAAASRAIAAADGDDKPGRGSPHGALGSHRALSSLLQALDHESVQKPAHPLARAHAPVAAPAASSSSSTASER